MSYEVLARKWRPKTFAELVGQEHVARALINGLDRGRLHHAFLFTGTRGVGKTTIARIFAKALNCELGVGSEPCGTCAVCVDVDAGRFVDLVEVDAASRTKVDDTRELLDNVQYAPARGRFKVYLIDEVHMLSTHSFNALLKTLEEPPPHVKFLLATTDPQKLPVTVLSRCLQFNLKRLTVDQIAGYLRRVLDAEAVPRDEDAVAALASAADGSMRDALSLLDQAIAFGAGRLAVDEVRAMLGTVAHESLESLLDALVAGDGEALWAAARALAEYAPDYGTVLRDLAALLHAAAVAQVVPTTGEGYAARLAEQLAPEDLQLAYEIAVQARATLHLAPDPRLGFEMALLRMFAFRPAVMDGPEPASESGSEPGTGGTAGSKGGSARAAARRAAGLASPGGPGAQARPPVDAAPSAPSPRLVEPAAPAASVARPQAPRTAPDLAMDAGPAGAGEGLVGEAADRAPAADDPASPPTDWNSLYLRLGLRGTAAVLAANSVLETVRPGELRLVVDPAQSHLRTPAAEARIRTALARLFGHDVRVDFVERASASESPAARDARAHAERRVRARRAIEDDPLVQALREDFGATLIPESIRPLDN